MYRIGGKDITLYVDLDLHSQWVFGFLSRLWHCLGVSCDFCHCWESFDLMAAHILSFLHVYSSLSLGARRHYRIVNQLHSFIKRSNFHELH
jgi:hypothetical protein